MTFTLSRSLRRCTLAVVVLALLAYGVSSGGAAAAFLGISLAGAGWWLTEGTSRWLAPKWLIASLLVLVIARGLWTLSNRPATSIAPFLTFLASILVVKCWERRGPRDVAQLLTVASFVLIGSALGSNSFGTGLLIALAFPILVHAALVLQLDGARARAEAVRGISDGAPPSQRGRPWRASLSLSLIGVALAAAVFVIVPRTQGSAGLAALGLSGTRLSGFRDRIDLGTSGFISLSQTIVMEVEVLTGDGVPSIAGPEGQLYLRGAALTAYNHEDGTWKQYPRRPDDAFSSGSDFPSDAPISLTTAGIGRDPVELLVRDRDHAGDHRPIFAPWRPTRISHHSAQNVQIEVDPETGTAVLSQALPSEYRITCTPDAGAADEARERVATPDSPVIARFAKAVLDPLSIAANPLVRPATDDPRAVHALEQYLRDNFTYTRNLLAPPQGTPALDWFLDSAREGHCEYFASALAALCRSIGVNARVVTGYVTGEFDPSRRVYTARQAGAHAWVEAEIAPGRWRTFDATPTDERTRLAGSEHGVLLSLERWLASLETTWNSSVVNYGHESTRSGFSGGRTARAIVEWSQRIEDLVRRVGIVPVLTWSLIALGGLSLTLALVGAGVQMVVRRMRRRTGSGAAVRGEAAELYARVLSACDRLGSPKPPWRGALEHAGTLPEQARPHAQTALGVCYQAFFADARVSPEALERARLAVEAMEQVP
jgi:transglutaminase-like putative cysteine protease